MILSALRCSAYRLTFRSQCRPFLRSQLSTSSLRSHEVFKPSQSLRFEVRTYSTSKPIDPVENAEPEHSFLGKVGMPGIRRQITFVVVTSLVAFVYAGTQTQVETENWKKKMTMLSPVWNLKSITNTDLKRVQNAELIQSLRETLANIQSSLQQLPTIIQPWINVAVVGIMQPYADASEGKRLCWKICMLNGAVWAAWKIKQFQPFMTRSFLSNPLSGLSYTLLTSVFSHQSVIHLLFNCLALESFGSAAHYYLLREQNKAEPEILESTTSYHFLAFFMTAGMFSNLVSHVVSAKFRYPRLIAQVASSTTTKAKPETWAGAVAAASASKARPAVTRNSPQILPGLGASGAIYAAVTMTALAFPDSQVALFIPPSHPINIQYGVGGLMLLDTIGIIRGWRYFDHWAHLGGATFGIFYYFYGPGYWRKLRQDIIDAEGRS